MVKPSVRSMQGEDGVITIDDSIVEKPYTDENELICWHYDHAQGRMVKGINFITALYTVGEVSLPVTHRLVSKTESHIDKKGNRKRRSAVTKNEHFRAMLQNCVRNRIPCRYVLNDVWFAAAENMSYVKLKLDKEFIMALKTNRKVALCQQDKLHGRYHRLNQLDLPENTVTVIYLEQVSFPLYLLRQTCTNADGSTAVRYLVTSDSALTADQLITIYQKRWKVEEYHRSLKQNASSPNHRPAHQPRKPITLWLLSGPLPSWSCSRCAPTRTTMRSRPTCISRPCNRLSRPCASWNQCVLTPRLRNMSYAVEIGANTITYRIGATEHRANSHCHRYTNRNQHGHANTGREENPLAALRNRRRKAADYEGN